MSVKPNPQERITAFADRLGYPSVQIFMSLNPDGVKTTDSGVPYVDVNTLYRTPTSKHRTRVCRNYKS